MKERGGHRHGCGGRTRGAVVARELDIRGKRPKRLADRRLVRGSERAHRAPVEAVLECDDASAQARQRGLGPAVTHATTGGTCRVSAGLACKSGERRRPRGRIGRSTLGRCCHRLDQSKLASELECRLVRLRPAVAEERAVKRPARVYEHLRENQLRPRMEVVGDVLYARNHLLCYDGGDASVTVAESCKGRTHVRGSRKHVVSLRRHLTIHGDAGSPVHVLAPFGVKEAAPAAALKLDALEGANAVGIVVADQEFPIELHAVHEHGGQDGPTCS